MGTLEKQAKKERRLKTFQKAMLMAALGGLLIASGASLSPTFFSKYFRGYKRGARFNFQAKTALGRLAKKELIIFEERDGKRYARITEKGKNTLAFEAMRSGEAWKPKRWDKRWRVVIFDIPEYRRGVRNRLRLFMQEYGFIRLQNSVWIYPYDCEDLIALVKADLRLGVGVLYMIVEELEFDKHLREHFGLGPMVSKT